MEVLSIRIHEDDEDVNRMKDGYSNNTTRHQHHQQLKLELDDNDDVDLERLLSRPIHRPKLPICEAPEFVKRLCSYEEVELGDAVTFWVQYRAFPSATVKWYKDEEEIRETKRHQLDSSSEENGIVRLIVQDVKSRDEGAYKCKVENQEGVASTTGYLSVSGKPSRSNRLQKTKMISDRTVSTPPFLRPIAEQKSMEEQEEAEYSRLPPSPLQAFIDNIRRSAKSGPIYYGSDNYYEVSDYESNDDFEEDVFGDENNTDGQSSDRTYESTAEEDDDQDETSSEPDRQPAVCLQAVDSFISPSVDWNTSNDDSAYGSDTTIGYSPSEEENTEELVIETTAEVTTLRNEGQTPKTGLRERRNRLHLQRSAAMELSDSIPETSDLHLRILDNQKPAVEIRTDNLSDHRTSPHDYKQTNSVDLKSVNQDKMSPNSISITPELMLDLLDFPCVQFFLSLVTLFTALGPATQIPLSILLPVLFLVSLIAFAVLLQHDRSSQ